MPFKSWIALLFQPRPRPIRGKTPPRSRQLSVDPLEDRIVPATPINSSFEASPDLAGWTTLPGTIAGTATVVRSGGTDGSAYANLAFSGSVTTGGVGFGPILRSSEFFLGVNETIAADLRTVPSGDDALLRAYLYDINGTRVGTLLDSRATVDTGWLTVSTIAPSAGLYYLEFQVGSFDASFGGAIGGNLRIDNLRTGITGALTADIVDVYSPRTATVSSVDVTFSQPIDSASFTVADLTLTLGSSTTNLITNAVTITPVDSLTYRINNLAGLTTTNGVYALTLNTTGIQTPGGSPGVGTAFQQWEKVTTRSVSAPTVTMSSSNTLKVSASAVSSTITQRGIVYSLTSVNSSPTIGGTGVIQVNAGTTEGPFTANATSLTPGVGYSIAAYLIDGSGTLYSGVVTSTITAPTLNATLANGSLTITDGDATGVPNALNVYMADGVLFIRDSIQFFVSAPAGATLSADGRTLSIPVSSITSRLTVTPLGGNDTIAVQNVTSTLAASLLLDGGAGTDVINLSDVSLGNGSINALAEAISLSGSIDTGGRNVTLTGSSISLLGSITTGGGCVTLSSNGDVTLAAPGNITTGGGQVIIRADSDADRTGLLRSTAAGTISTAGGAVTISTSFTEFMQGSIAAGIGNVSVTPSSSGTPLLLSNSTIGFGVATGSTGADTVTASFVDANGNLYLAGTMAGASQPKDFAGNLLTGFGGADVYVAKLDRNGVQQWFKFTGSTGADAVSALSVDGSGNVYVAGTQTGTSTPRDFTGATVTGFGGTDLFVAKFNSAGTQQWFKFTGSTGADAVSALSVDGSGNVYVAGTQTSTSTPRDFTGAAVTGRGSTDLFVAKLNSAGTQQWFKYTGSTGADAVSALSVDGSGNVYVAGTQTGTTTPRDFTGATVTGFGGTDVFVTKLDSAGTQQWFKFTGSTSTDAVAALTVDTVGNVYVTGTQTGTSTPRDFTGATVTGFGGTDLFVTKLDSAGTQQWFKFTGSTGADTITGLAVDAGNNVYVAGTQTSTTTPRDFANATVTGFGGTDIFLSKLDSSGNPQWFDFLGSSGAETVFKVFVDANGTTRTVGTFTNAVDLSIGIGLACVASNGGADLFGIKLHASGRFIEDYVLPDTLLDRVAAGTFTLGNAASGSITVDQDITRAAATNMILSSGGNIAIRNGQFDTAGGTLLLRPGAGSAVLPTFTGTDVSSSTVSFDGNLAIKIANATSFDVFTANGTVNLAGAGLVLTGSYVPVDGDEFTIVSASNRTGTFLGLGNNASLTFNGKTLYAVYGGTGMKLTTVSPVNALPTVGRDQASVSGNEAALLTTTGTFADADGNSTVVLTASVGNITQDNANGTWTWSYTPDDGPIGATTVTVTATDSLSAAANTTFSFSVTNVNPTATVGTNSGVVYGGAAIVNLTAAFDPSTADTTAGFRYAFAIDTDTTGNASYATANPSGTASFGALAAGNYTVYARILDKDGGFTAYTETLTVAQAGSTSTVAWSDGTSVAYDGNAHGATASWVSSGTDGATAALVVTYVGINGTSYAATATAPSEPGEYRATASFAGDDNHTGSTATHANLTITKASPTVAVNAVNLTYGTALAHGQLSGTASYIVSGSPVSVAGAYTFTTTAGTVPTPGNGQTFAVTFTPTDATHYSAVSTSVTVNVSRATPNTSLAEINITYGTALSGASQLSGNATWAVGGNPVSVAGVFSFTTAEGTVPGAGNGHNVAVTFTPTDTALYTATRTTVAVNVAKASPSVSVNVVNITFGTTLTGATQLAGNATWTINGSPVSVPGTLTYTATEGTTPTAGNGQSVSVTFTPADATNYQSVTTTATLNVAKATPSVSVTAVNIIYGTVLANSQLTGTATYLVNGSPVAVPGTFTYTTAVGTVLNAGNGQTASVTFTPSDTSKFNPVTTTVTINVAKALATVTLSPINITYGTALSNSMLAGTATWVVNGVTVNVAGTFSFTTVGGSVLNTGSNQLVSVTFTPFDTTDYEMELTTVIVNVGARTTITIVPSPTGTRTKR